MGRYSKPLDLYKAQRARFDALNLTMRQAHRELANAGLEDARQLTGGELTPNQTRGAFARGLNPASRTDAGLKRGLTKRQIKGRGLPPGGVPLLPINMQSHKLHKSMRLEKKSGGAIGQQFDLTQDDPGGGLFRLKPGGTTKMVDSGFFAEIKKRWKARNKAFIDSFRDKQKRST